MSQWHVASKALIGIGLLLVAAGLFWQFAGRHLPLGRLPGDIAIDRPGFRLYFPLATCLLISAVVSALVLLWRYLSSK